MATRYSNTSGVPLSLAVFLATDHYAHDDRPNVISVTTLMKPLKQIVLARRIDKERREQGHDNIVDLIPMLPSRMGTAIHNGIEDAWINHYKEALKALNIPQRVIDKVIVNPKPEDLYEGCIPVYTEYRTEKQVGDWIITGEFDFVAEGCVEDFKSTSTFTATSGNKDDDYIMQGSLYRWLNPTIITDNRIKIQWIFTDWSAMRAKTDPKYPQQRFKEHILPLKSIAEVDAYVKRKLALIEQYQDVPEADIPQCDDSELWRSDPVYKYYKGDPKTASRSTKNFTDEQEARVYFSQQNGVGTLVTVPGQVMACRYCPGFVLCTQKDALVASGDLVL